MRVLIFSVNLPKIFQERDLNQKIVLVEKKIANIWQVQQDVIFVRDSITGDSLDYFYVMIGIFPNNIPNIFPNKIRSNYPQIADIVCQVASQLNYTTGAIADQIGRALGDNR